ncbi:methyl-accepting chemotaxis protein [Pseudomonas sp. 2725]
MNFRSIKYTVVVSAGMCFAAVVLALIAFSIYSSSQMNSVTKEKTEKLATDLSRQYQKALTEKISKQLEIQLQKPLQLVKSLAQTNEIIGIGDANSHVPLSRENISTLAKNTLINNPELLDVFIGWEPNAFDENDKNFANTKKPGYDQTGRFMPVWYRDENGKINIIPLGAAMESDKKLPTGIREGEYYLCTKESRASCVIDPAPYEVDGKSILMSTFTAPIIVDGIFRGMVGADLTLGFIQDLLLDANKSLYEGAGGMKLITENFRTVANTSDPASLGNKINEEQILQLKEALRKIGNSSITEIDNMETQSYELFLPFTIGTSNTKWILIVELPRSVVLEKIKDLETSLTIQQEKQTFGMIGVGLLITCVGMIFLWMLGAGVAKPMNSLATMLDEVAKGDGDLTRRLTVNRRDEMGSIARSFNSFLDKLQLLITEIVNSVSNVSTTSENSANGSLRTHENILKQQIEISQVAAAINQMSATAQEVAKSAASAATSANQADLSATKGRLVVAKGAKSITQLAEEVARAVIVVQQLAKDSRNIDEILVTISSIAEQTNLLALNAAIEAARAGENGRGFAVVADEVRGLASKTQAATQKIQSMIKQLQESTKEIVLVMEESQRKASSSVEHTTAATNALEDITKSVSIISDMNIHIASSAEEQSAVAEDINRNVVAINLVADEVALLASETSKSSKTLSNLSNEQKKLIEHFKV